MTPSPPDEALHFRGKTLTPESPRPLHIPEPANIPVLENQMDPVFNDTSTYERSEYPNSHPHRQDGWSDSLPKGHEHVIEVQDSGSLYGTQPDDVVMDNMAVPSNIYQSTPGSSGQTMNANPDLNHATPVVPVSQSYAVTGEIDNAGGSGNPQPPNRLDDGGEDTGSSTAGVNFQTLLDNLSQPPAALSSGAPPIVEDSLFHQAPPTDESLQAQGLPARPPNQDPPNPSTYSNDALSYHQNPSIPATAYATQSSNNTQTYPPLPSAGAPGTIPVAGTLPPPPPPMASFQQTPSTGGESQSSLEAAQTSKKGRADKQLGRPAKGSDDDSPWGPDVQKKYDEFLHDERIYVTEGLWDRFPIGSRLFVGEFPVHLIFRILQPANES